MKDNEIKRALDKIKTDEEMKSRILENVYKEVETNRKSESNKFQLIYLKNKKVISTLAASMVLVCGVFLYNNQNINKSNTPSASPGMEQPPSDSPMTSENRGLESEFNNFDLESLKDKTTKIEIINNENYAVIKDIDDIEFINSCLEFIESAKEKDIKYENYASEKEMEEANEFLDKVRESQLTGNSLVMRFVTNDYSSAIRVYLDLNIIDINKNYYEVSSDMGKIIDKELDSIK